MSCSRLLATIGACMRAAAAVLAFGAFITSPRLQMFVEALVLQRVLVDIDPAGLVRQGLWRTKSGAVCGGQTWIMSKSAADLLLARRRRWSRTRPLRAARRYASGGDRS
jgi:hypothetical protein